MKQLLLILLLALSINVYAANERVLTNAPTNEIAAGYKPSREEIIMHALTMCKSQVCAIHVMNSLYVTEAEFTAPVRAFLGTLKTIADVERDAKVKAAAEEATRSRIENERKLKAEAELKAAAELKVKAQKAEADKAAAKSAASGDIRLDSKDAINAEIAKRQKFEENLSAAVDVAAIPVPLPTLTALPHKKEPEPDAASEEFTIIDRSCSSMEKQIHVSGC